eukprot:GHUV01039460.1.p2 GENE.GHUV01039460.1~~GHUV01039460.1.p2  ORF type:complete len:140 (-),score=38.64 GHUV01039460.1:330-749(-)
MATLACRMDAGTMSLERPSTANRQRGRVPMTVLELTAQLLGNNSTTAAVDGQQDRQSEQFTSRSGSEACQPGPQQSDAGQQQQPEGQQGSAAPPAIPLKVCSCLRTGKPIQPFKVDRALANCNSTGATACASCKQHALP